MTIPFTFWWMMIIQVIEKYKVSGIPTKFIIDSEGNIRFKSIGFAGSDDKLVEELSTMVSLIK